MYLIKAVHLPIISLCKMSVLPDHFGMAIIENF